MIALLVLGLQLGPLEASEPRPAAPECAREGRRLQRQPACAWGKAVYLVAWSDGSRQLEKPTADIYCARLDAGTGKSLDPQGIRVCSAVDLQEWPAVAFDGSNFLVVWQDLRSGKDYDVYAARVGEDGKVLDPEGFPVARRPANQARPAVGFASGHALVAWMDAREYPAYGLYAARVTPDGKVMDPDGVAIDVEDPAKIAKARPPETSWLGDRHYWWGGLSSRFQPAVASNGRECLVTYLREAHANKTMGYAVLVDPARGAPLGAPVKLSGEPRDRLAACATPDGWTVAFDHWESGWSPSARVAALRLDAALKPLDEIPIRESGRKSGLPEAPLLDPQKALAEGGETYQQGKGHFSFWQSAAAWNGGSAIVVMDYAWRAKQRPADLTYAIIAARVSAKEPRFLDAAPLVVASGTSREGRSVHNPALAAGPGGEVLLVYEEDAGIDRLSIQVRLLRQR